MKKNKFKDIIIICLLLILSLPKVSFAKSVDQTIALDINKGSQILEKARILNIDSRSYVDTGDLKKLIEADPNLARNLEEYKKSGSLIKLKSKSYLPLREFFEKAGYRVVWDQKLKMVFIDNEELDSLSKLEEELAREINKYRQEEGLEPLKISKSLTKLSRYHIYDLNNNYNNQKRPKDIRDLEGNLHSWSNKGFWKEVVYTRDHKYKELMWSKAREISEYKGSSYEIAYWNSQGLETDKVLKAWKNSKGHNNLIVGKGPWKEIRAMGVGLDGNYAVVWFGMEEDPAGYY